MYGVCDDGELIMTEWFEDESFWIELYPFMFPDERFEGAGEEIDKVIDLLHFQGSTILDLCCGPGRHSIELAKRGYTVTGVDRTRFLLDKARDRAAGENVDVEWIQEDMRRFVRTDTYDLVLSMFTSFGYSGDENDNIVVLHNMFESLKPGGAVLLEMMGKERLARIFQPTTSQTAPNGSILVERHHVFSDWTRMGNEWIIIRKGGVRSFKFHHTVYSGRELRGLLEDAGFTHVVIYGSLEGDVYDIDARRLIAVGTRPE
jgi:SAM-dependent methyltransferase